MTTLAPTVDHPTRSPLGQVPGIVAALAGRFAWRLWWPLVAWLAAAGIARAQAMGTVLAPGEGGPIATWPSGVLLIAGLVAIPILWAWGARYALTLGQHRGVVFGVTIAVSLLLQAALHVVSVSTALIEYRLAGPDGVRVFALDTGNTFGTQDTLWNASWLFGFYYVLPVMVLLVTASTAIARWGGLGALTLIAIPVVLAVVAGLVALGGAWPVTAALFVALLVGAVVAAWWIFRGVRA